MQFATTLTILLEALPDAADDITDFLYKESNASLGEQNEYRFFAREDDADFFRVNIQETGGVEALVASTTRLADSQLPFRENAKLLLDRARSLTQAEATALMPSR